MNIRNTHFEQVPLDVVKKIVAQDQPSSFVMRVEDTTLRQPRRNATIEYDLFERLPDGSVLWRDVIVGHETAIRKLVEFAALTPNECVLMHTPTHEVVATVNVPRQPRANVQG